MEKVTKAKKMAADPTPKVERERKLALLQRSLGIRHKLKVHESMKMPETHDELSVVLLAKWELEDELAAIDDVVGEIRKEEVRVKRIQIVNEYLKAKEPPKARKK